MKCGGGKLEFLGLRHKTGLPVPSLSGGIGLHTLTLPSALAPDYTNAPPSLPPTPPPPWPFHLNGTIVGVVPAHDDGHG